MIVVTSPNKRVPRTEEALRAEIARLADELRVLSWGGISPKRSAEYRRLSALQWELEQELRRLIAARLEGKGVAR